PILLKDSNFKMSTGDEAGSIGGMISGKIKGKSEPQMYSFDVKIDGKNPVRLLDIMLNNDKNTPPFPVLQPPSIVVMVPAPETSTPPNLTKFDMPEGEQEKAQ
ncbi:DUF4150 domain-containing protein, partial [Nitrospira sp. BLG_2]|uniref:DUF4150 domain-containing protein n=1 Tax=Nitrospira sp. BLG_2 TaxID=3397507 RepID=UPI003B9A8E37